MRRLTHFAEDGDTSGFFPALAKYHSRDKYAVTFATLKRMEPWLEQFMRERGIETFSCGANGRLSYPRAVARLTSYMRARHCDIFHAHLFEPSVVGLAAAWLARVPARLLTRHYSNYHTRIHRPLHVKLDQLCTALAHRVIGVSNETAEHLVRVEGAPVSKVSTIHNGIDFDRVKPSGADARARIREELGLGDTFVFLVAARFHPEKGYEDLFDAIRRVRGEATRPFQFLIAGRGPFQRRYEAIVGSYGIADRVRFLGFRRDLPDLMVASDVFVLPSLAEAFGLVLAEAVYLGLPVLATRIGGIPEIVDDGVDGRLVPPGDPSALAEGMLLFLGGELSLPGVGPVGAAKIRARFDFVRMVRAYEEVYDGVLNA